MGLIRKGIILAGGCATRLYPVTLAISKQLLPVYDKPMIYYPLSTLMIAGIRDILVITTALDISRFKMLLGNGAKWGISLKYLVQDEPQGIAQALLIAESFLDGHPCSLILGDNIFYDDQLGNLLSIANKQLVGAHIFSCHVNDPCRYGVLGFDGNGNIKSITEKPIIPESNAVVTGLYFYDEQAPKLARELQPSARGEFEISELNRLYLQQGKIAVTNLAHSSIWLDAGTHDSLQEAGHIIKTIENNRGLKVGCPEEIAWRKKWISDEELHRLALPLVTGGYGRYLICLLDS
ncbi:glucose-1-phosphate thymidylyltransferase RfbA [Aeromonas bestiarum]|uniref:glucose-1-phosphate thymidylyltransferase RfbA n=1 Tax=Aeromonas bestiarum TaxID=105751 RepID=UPI0032B255D4